ncbi:MAG TPA: protein kinase [Solirubrobacteraceae bacterium]|nr:protein kinase [Solirubrobacteraceae bacterium]
MADGNESASAQIAIVLADDHPLIRNGLRRVLDLEGGFKVVGEAGDVAGALALTLAHRPGVVVLDLNMPGESTLTAIPRFVDAAPGTAVLVLTMEADPGFARQALQAGARGYVLKERAETELVEAVRAVTGGRTYLDPSVGAHLAQTTGDRAGRPSGLTHEDPKLAIGAEFAAHRIDALVGRGGMGLVFRATDLVLDRTVALKVIAPEVAENPTYRARFERECRLAAALDHPNVVQIFHAGAESGLLYLSMRFVDGVDLRELLDEEKRLEPARATLIATQIAAALEEAHRHGLVHRDVKPGNVLISGRSHEEHAFLTDFGITRRADQEPLTRTGVALGSVDYMAPEQAHGGEVDARTDIYSLGCVLYEMLTGRVVFERDGDLEKLWAHVHDRPPRLPEGRMPPGLQDVLDRALAKDPRARQQSAAELASQVTAAVVG